MRWEREVPLAPLTRYGIGGPAAKLARPGSREEVREALGSLGGEPHLVLGGGANVLVADGGVDAAVLVLGGDLEELRVEARTIRAGAAARLPALAGAARREGRAGWSFLEAVPGTAGGGLRMNAGSREEWLWHRVRWAEALTPAGEAVRLAGDEVEHGYRRVEVPESWVFVEAEFDAPPGDREAVREEHLTFRRRKVEAQVYALPSVGSTWKNPGPPHGSAWEVVERVGMRGARRGGARISEKHANFIVNHEEARAEDVVWLMAETRRRAREELGLLLEPEIRLWGFGDEVSRALGAPASAGAADARTEGGTA